MKTRQCCTGEENAGKKWPIWLARGHLKSVSKQELGVEKEKETPQKVWLVWHAD